MSNGNCASTCAMFSTLMNERHNTKIAVFGGKPGENVEFKGRTLRFSLLAMLMQCYDRRDGGESGP